MNTVTLDASKKNKKQRGFTLVELMIVVVIIGILTSVAIPSYRQYVIRGKRTAAEAEMMSIANREEQYLLANRAYADKATLEANGYAFPSEIGSNYSYDVTLGAGTVPSYTITFTGINAQASDGALSLTSDGTKSPASKW